MTTESIIVAIVSAIGPAILGLMISRINKRLDHIEDLRIADARQQAEAAALAARVSSVEVQSHRWDEVIQAITRLCDTLARLPDRLVCPKGSER